MMSNIISPYHRTIFKRKFYQCKKFQDMTSNRKSERHLLASPRSGRSCQYKNQANCFASSISTRRSIRLKRFKKCYQHRRRAIQARANISASKMYRKSPIKLRKCYPTLIHQLRTMRSKVLLIITILERHGCKNLKMLFAKWKTLIKLTAQTCSSFFKTWVCQCP